MCSTPSARMIARTSGSGRPIGKSLPAGESLSKGDWSVSPWSPQVGRALPFPSLTSRNSFTFDEPFPHAPRDALAILQRLRPRRAGGPDGGRGACGVAGSRARRAPSREEVRAACAQCHFLLHERRCLACRFL